jgi:hypothetical protein
MQTVSSSKAATVVTLGTQTTGAARVCVRKAGMEDLRVLFLQKNSRMSYFQSLIAAARNNWHWDVQVVCASEARRLWRDVVNVAESFHLVPDFNKPQAWESDAGRVAEIDALIAECEQASGVSADASCLPASATSAGAIPADLLLVSQRDRPPHFDRQHRVLPHPAPDVRICPCHTRRLPPRRRPRGRVGRCSVLPCMTSYYTELTEPEQVQMRAVLQEFGYLDRVKQPA